MIFPGLKGMRVAGPVNLDEYYARWARRHYYTCPNPSPALTPRIASAMLDEMHRDCGAYWSWGSLYEDRSRLWRGGYMAASRAYIHLGVDLNVPSGTIVRADAAGKVARIDNDTSTGGWGTRVIVELYAHPIVLIYAHLRPGPDCEAGRALLQGKEFGVVGDPAVNGGWFPHLHLQAMTKEAWGHYRERLDALDGYGPRTDLARLMREFPDPMPYIRLS